MVGLAQADHFPKKMFMVDMNYFGVCLFKYCSCMFNLTSLKDDQGLCLLFLHLPEWFPKTMVMCPKTAVKRQCKLPLFLLVLKKPVLASIIESWRLILISLLFGVHLLFMISPLREWLSGSSSMENVPVAICMCVCMCTVWQEMHIHRCIHTWHSRYIYMRLCVQVCVCMPTHIYVFTGSQ